MEARTLDAVLQVGEGRIRRHGGKNLGGWSGQVRRSRLSGWFLVALQEREGEEMVAGGVGESLKPQPVNSQHKKLGKKNISVSQ